MNMADIDRSLEALIAKTWRLVWRNFFVFFFAALVTVSGSLLSILSLQSAYDGTTLLIGGKFDLEQPLDGTQRAVQTPVDLARIASSDDVVIEAINNVGLYPIIQGFGPIRPSLSAKIRNLIFPGKTVAARAASPIETYLPMISGRLSIRSEPSTDVTQISFRHPDAVIAAKFANAIAQATIDRQTMLYSRLGAVDFFKKQSERFEQEVEIASKNLRDFSIRTGIYSVPDQRKLLLKRLNDLSTASTTSRGLLSSESGERQALADALRRLAPVARSPYVSGLVDALGGERGSTRPGAADHGQDDRSSDPPLLLVKVYQESMVALFKTYSDIAGAQNLLKQQLLETSELTNSLNTLSQNEAEFSRLKRTLDQAVYNSDLYSKRMTEEQIDAESRAAKLVSAKVLQKATPPLRPAFPNLPLLGAVAVVASVFVGLAAVSLWTWMFPRVQVPDVTFRNDARLTLQTRSKPRTSRDAS